MADYSEQWRDYRRVRNEAFLAFFGIIPLVLLGLLLQSLFGISRLIGFVVAVIMLVWFFTTVFTLAQLSFWRCPRCGEYFGNKWWYRKTALIARRCVHCGLAKFANE